jgi:hypothetical protein
MLGRPFWIAPVFMKAWAGSWLICSVWSERITQISSAIPPMCGKISAISVPQRPRRSNLQNGPNAWSFMFWSWRAAGLGERVGERFPVKAAQLGFGVESLDVGRSTRHAEVDDVLRPRRMVQRVQDAAPALDLGWRKKRRMRGDAVLAEEERESGPSESVSGALEERAAADALLRGAGELSVEVHVAVLSFLAWRIVSGGLSTA